ncbi:MAG: ComEA family DNA-binding protein [Anaerolineales bacterium]|jgi:competence protein ComEA|nr:ComEA family DNA-binding protein [Anaerolineales bacterium]
MKRVLDIFGGILLGLLAAGAVFLSARAPSGKPVELLPTVSPQPIIVYVVGAVQQPGVYALPPESRVLDAVQAAGGFSDLVILDQVNVAQRIEDGQRLEIPGSGELPTPAFIIGESGLFLTPTPFSGALVNINTADITLLDTLPGIGPTMAQRIVDYRQENGDFTIVEDLLKVAGIGPATLEKFRSLVTVGDVTAP